MKIILFDLSEDKKKDFDLSEYDKKDDSEQEDCENELQTGVDLSGYPGQQGLSFSSQSIMTQHHPIE